MLWKNEGQAKVFNFSHNHISMQFDDFVVNFECLLTGSYGEPDSNKTTKTQKLFKDLRLLTQSLQMVVGDFNEILCPYQKQGDRQRNKNLMQNFSETLVTCDLRD